MSAVVQQAMGPGIEFGATGGNVRVGDGDSLTPGGRAGGRVAVGTHAQQTHSSHDDHDTATTTRDIKRTYRTIRGGKTSEVYHVHTEGSKLDERMQRLLTLGSPHTKYL